MSMFEPLYYCRDCAIDRVAEAVTFHDGGAITYALPDEMHPGAVCVSCGKALPESPLLEAEGEIIALRHQLRLARNAG